MALTIDGWDASEFQASPVWADMTPYSFVAHRATHGTYRDPTFPGRWALMARLPARWKVAYCLTTGSTVGAQVGAFIGQVEASGVPWADGMVVALDCEDSPHTRSDVATSIAIGEQLCAWAGTPMPLVYVGAFHRCMAIFDARPDWPHWLPWPVASNGPVPADLQPAVHQWATVGPGETAGWPDDNVDANQVLRAGALDMATNLTNGLTDPQAALLAQLAADMADVRARVADVQTATTATGGAGEDSLAFRSLRALERLDALAGRVGELAGRLDDLAEHLAPVVAEHLADLLSEEWKLSVADRTAELFGARLRRNT